MNYNLS